MRKWKLNENDFRLLLLLTAFLLLAGSYFLCYRPNLARAEALRAANAEKASRVSELQAMLLHEQEEQERKEKMLQELEEIEAVFPIKWTEEKAIAMVEELEAASGIEVTNLSFQMEQPYTAGEEAEASDMLAVSCLTLSFQQAAYEEIKAAIRFINSYADRITIETLSCAYASADQGLTGTLTLNLYAMKGTGKAYEPPVILNVPTGVENIFRSGS